MIRLQPVTTSDTKHYQFMEKLLIASFPPQEYRPMEDLREYTDRMKHFHNCIIFDNEFPVGFITYWDFERFYYIEHFATSPALRNSGYGRRILEHLYNHLKLPIVLEVERATDEMSKRRIDFYCRHGFELWENDYHQPPYKPGDDSIPMYLMVHGDLNAEKDFEAIKCRLYANVYGVREME